MKGRGRGWEGGEKEGEGKGEEGRGRREETGKGRSEGGRPPCKFLDPSLHGTPEQTMRDVFQATAVAKSRILSAVMLRPLHGSRLSSTSRIASDHS